MNAYPDGIRKAICMALLGWAWGAAAVFAGSSPRAVAIYEDALGVMDLERESGAGARQLSEIALSAAVKCQELGAHGEAEKLFRIAVEEDPENAQAYRRYGDYLSLYRGKYSLSFYETAAELMRKHPEDYDEEERVALERSVAILHRDAYDGVPVLRTRNLSVFVEPWVQYRRGSKRQMELYEEYLNARCYYDNAIAEQESGVAYFSGLVADQKDGVGYFETQAAAARDGVRYFHEVMADAERGFNDWYSYITNMFWTNYGYIPGDTEILDFDAQGNPVSIQSRRAEKDAYVAQLRESRRRAAQDAAYFDERAAAAEGEQKETEERVEEIEREKSQNEINRARLERELRRQVEELAYGMNVNVRFGGEALLRFFAERAEVLRSIFNPEDREHQSDGTYTRYGSLFRPPVISLNSRLDLALEGEVSLREALLENSQTGLRLGKEDTLEYGGRGQVTWFLNHRTLRLNLEAFGQDIDVEGQDKDDTGDRQLASLRYSIYPPSAEERFGQNRSTHWEAGVLRAERTFRGHPDFDIRWKPVQYFFVSELLGLRRGRFDLVSKYVLQELEYSDGCKKGVYHTHEFTVTPAWVPVYALYDRAFVSGAEVLRIGFPLKLSTGEGDFDSYGAGFRVEQRFVTRRRFAVQSGIGFDYTRYHELDVDDWGVYVKVAINAGRVPLFR